MFDTAIAEPCPGCGERLPEDDLDGVLERLLADADALDDLPPIDQMHDEGDEPEFTYGSCAPSGWLALDLDIATADPAQLTDHTLIEAIVGFDRLASWAAARQARLLAELARRRPTDQAPYSARWAGVGSEYAPDEVGVALRLARGTAVARVGLACRLLATLSDTHAAWEAGLIDTAKARAIDDATWMLSVEHARAVQERVLPRAAEQTLAQLKARWRARSSRSTPTARSSDIAMPVATGGSWSPRRPTGWRRCGRCSPPPRPPGRSPG